MFLFADNSTVETAVAKGNSPSRKLFELVKRLKTLQMKYGFEIHVIHVAGTRMIMQGTDGLSRGDVTKTLLNTKPLRFYAPIHLNALERLEGLDQWIKSWSGSAAMFLNPENWFVEAHDLRLVGERHNLKIESGTYIWTPPPCITDVTLEQLRCARIKRQDSIHIMVVPKLFFSLWRRQLYKAMDMILCLLPGLKC